MTIIISRTPSNSTSPPTTILFLPPFNLPPPLGEPVRRESDANLLCTLASVAGEGEHAIGGYRQLVEALRRLGSRAPVWIRNTATPAVRGDNSFLSKLIEASFLSGALFC